MTAELPPGRPTPPRPQLPKWWQWQRHDPRRLAVGATVIAALSMLVAGLSIGVATSALDRAESAEAKARAALAAAPPAYPGPGSTAPPPATTSTVNTPSATPPASTGIAIPATEPPAAYRNRELRIEPAPDCNSTRAVDLDEPRVGVDPARAELTYGICIVTGVGAQFDIADGLPIATVPRPTVTARECLTAIRDAPINEPVDPRAGLNLCLATAAAQARAQGIPQKVVLLSIRAVASDDTLTVRATAWNLPG